MGHPARCGAIHPESRPIKSPGGCQGLVLIINLKICYRILVKHNNEILLWKLLRIINPMRGFNLRNAAFDVISKPSQQCYRMRSHVNLESCAFFH